MHWQDVLVTIGTIAVFLAVAPRFDWRGIMREEEAWIYQRRDVPKPWAIQFFLHIRESGRSMVAWVYQEDIASKGQRVRIDLGHERTPDAYARKLEHELEAVCPVSASDHAQIVRAIDDLAFQPLEKRYIEL